MIPIGSKRLEVHVPLLTLAFMAACIWIFVAVQPSVAEREAAPPGVAVQSFNADNAAIPCEILRGSSLTQHEYQLVFVDRSTTECISAEGDKASPGKNVYASILYSMFLHAGWIHLAGNMLSLWVFGGNVEYGLGRAAYLGLYMCGGIVATLGHILYEAPSAIPIVGASGAIAAVMGAYLVMYPLSTIRVWLVAVIPMPAVLFLVGWFLLQFSIGDNSSVAWMAHVSGFIAGVVIAIALKARKRSQDAGRSTAIRAPNGRPAT